MRRLRHARPSPALIVAVIALVGALAGSAVAEQATTSISKKKTKKIAKRVANKQIDARLPIGAEEFGEMREVTEEITINANSNGATTADCNSDEQVISGGFRWVDAPVNLNLITQLDHRDGNGWRAGGRNVTAQNRQFRVHAYCLEP
jgi:ABC-type oligopeptide transport system substrate-binding subunit